MARSSRVVPLVLLFALTCSGCTWSMFGFGPDNTRFTPIVANVSASNVGTMVLKGTAATGGAIDSSPAVVTTGTNGHVTGTVYVGSEDGKLYAFDEVGSANCSGMPKSCTPLWTGATGGEITSSPAVVNGVVYVGSWDGKLYAFDATGTKNCSGTPKTCAPLWTGATNGQVIGPPTVANGVVYVRDNETHGLLWAFDANGTTNCSGTPKTCTALWSANSGKSGDGSPAVVNGVVYVDRWGDNTVYAYSH
jgi:outer membrane protein assembly factor BamB